METVTVQYLEALNIPVSEKYIKKSIASHPDYPSILSVADTFERLGLDYKIGRVAEEMLPDISFPCMLHLGKSGGKFVIVKNPGDLETLEADLKHWNGVVVTVDPESEIIDREHNEQLSREQARDKVHSGLLFSLGALIILSPALNFSLQNAVLIATAVAGAVVGYLLVAKELGITYKPVESFCKAGSMSNCDKILNAKAARPFGLFSLSDAVVSYFGFQLVVSTLIVPFRDVTTPVIGVLALASMAALPLVGYSVYYQRVKARTWCRLCLVVDGIMLLQAVFFFYLYYQGVLLSEAIVAMPVMVSGLLFASILLGVTLLKLKLNEIPALVQKETTALRVKNSLKVFTHLLFQGKKVDTSPLEADMRIGNPSAPVHIVMAVNLFCGPCKKAFDSVTRLIQSFPDKLSISFRLTPGGKPINGELPASTYLIRYWNKYIRGRTDEESLTQQILRDWYAQMDPGTFLQQYPLGKDDDLSVIQPEKEHYSWIKNASISRTPTFFVVGYELPGSYAIEDLIAIIPGLVPFTEAQKYKTHEFAG